MSLIQWKRSCDPFQQLTDLNDRLMGLTLFPNLDKSLAPFRGGWPALDVSEDKSNVIIKADLPGLKQEEIEVAIEDDVLTIRGERKAEVKKEEENYFRSERLYGAFERNLQLGVGVEKDKVKASYKNGVLEVTLPKSEKVKPKQIKVDVN
ncbi:MAG: Hsp20/alpha crystallin family protein [Candidatus Omnitrophota bacterium]